MQIEKPLSELSLSSEHVDLLISAFVYAERAVFVEWMDSLGLGERQKNKLMAHVERSREELESARLISRLPVELGFVTQERHARHAAQEEKIEQWNANRLST